TLPPGRTPNSHSKGDRTAIAAPASESSRSGSDSPESRQFFHRRQPGIPPSDQSDRTGGPQRFDRAHNRRDGRGKGTGGQADSRAQFPPVAAVRDSRVRRATGNPDAERI